MGVPGSDQPDDPPESVTDSPVGHQPVEVSSWLPAQVEDLGTVTTAMGDLVLIEFGILHLWSGQDQPILDPDDVGERVAAVANVGLEIVGEVPAAAGRALDLVAAAGRCVFDVPADQVDQMRDHVVSRTREFGFSVDVRAIERMPHRTRVTRLLDDSPDGVEGRYGGPWAVAARGLPVDRPLPVRGVRLPDEGPDRGRWQVIWVEGDARLPTRTEDIGHVLVDEAQLAFAHPDALTAWRIGASVDGLCDIAFWGRNAPSSSNEPVPVPRTTTRGAGPTCR